MIASSIRRATLGRHGRDGRRTVRRVLLCAVTAGAVAAGAVAPAAAAPASAGHELAPRNATVEPALPIIFVHGFSGSAAQYETQALRWASNGYPNVVTAIDRTGVGFNDQMDAFIENVLAETGDEQVYALGHSAGTALMNGYLNSSPERASKIAKYIAIDGATAAECPGGVPCMGIWARGNPARMMGPNHNVRFPEQGHTQSVTSPESFAAQYRFFTGQEPETTLVLPEPPGQVTIAGRALNFPANTGIEGATLQLWKVDPATGARASGEPRAETVVGPDGNFGPWRVNGQQRYELTVIREGPEGPVTQHFYYEPWIRDNHLIRLNISPIGSALYNAITAHRGPHTSVSIVRQKEWWGDNTVDPTDIDSLDIATTSPSQGDQPPVNIINSSTAPYTASTIAVIAFDIDVDQTNHLVLTTLGPFLSGVDVYMPATDPPDGTITFDHQQRRTDASQVINTPNWESDSRHGMTVTFREWVQDIDSWGECKSAKPSPCH